MNMKQHSILDENSGNTLMLEEAVPGRYGGSHVFFHATNKNYTQYVSGFVPVEELRAAVLDLTGGGTYEAVVPTLPEVAVVLDGDGDWTTVDGLPPDITGYVADGYTLVDVEEAAAYLLAIAAAKRKRGAIRESKEFQAMERFIEAFEEDHTGIFESSTEELAQALVEAGFRPPVDEA